MAEFAPPQQFLEAVALLDDVPLDELGDFRAKFEAGTRQLELPRGRPAYAAAYLLAIDTVASEKAAAEDIVRGLKQLLEEDHDRKGEHD